MKQRFAALRYFVGALALNLAFGLVAFAQQAASGQQQSVKEYAKSRIEGMVYEWTRARDYTKEYLDAMPEDGVGFKPTPDIRSFAEQMIHLASANFGFGARLTGQTNPHAGKKLEEMSEYKTKAALTKLVLESYDFMINGIQKLEDVKLDTRVATAGMNRPLTALFAAAFEHQTHHRGQTTIYLRLKGVKPPNEKLF